MDDIIKQIAQIDLVAVTNRENSEKALQEKRKQYENQMIAYREEKIKSAHQQAEEIYSKMLATGETGHNLEEERSRQATIAMQNKYLEIEENLINEVFSVLFRVEG